jgi:hypothetical protein
VSPYHFPPSPPAPTKYHNPNTFQIICAGYDGKFGPGGVWDPTDPTVTKEGRDDLSNFTGNRLEVAP